MSSHPLPQTLPQTPTVSTILLSPSLSVDSPLPLLFSCHSLIFEGLVVPESMPFCAGKGCWVSGEWSLGSPELFSSMEEVFRLREWIHRYCSWHIFFQTEELLMSREQLTAQVWGGSLGWSSGVEKQDSAPWRTLRQILLCTPGLMIGRIQGENCGRGAGQGYSDLKNWC